MDQDEIRENLLEDFLTECQKDAISSEARRLLVIAGAGSGKTDVMARRVAWWVGVEGISKDAITAFTFTEKAAEEMKYRIRKYLQRISDEGDVTLGGMYVGTIHGFCLKILREFWPDIYHNYDVIDEGGALALIQRGYFNILGLSALASATSRGQNATIDLFMSGYALLHEYNQFACELGQDEMPYDVADERDWCREAQLQTNVGNGNIAQAFRNAAARYYAYMRCRRFLDFSTAQSELVRQLQGDQQRLRQLKETMTHLVVDEVQDINPIQLALIELVTGETGCLTAVGDHRQAVYGWRGGRVEIMGALFDEVEEASDGEVIELQENFRSTERIIKVSNEWASTIGQVGTMTSPAMLHGKDDRVDMDSTHVACIQFGTRSEEAEWIVNSINKLVVDENRGAFHDELQGDRGITYCDIAILLRSATGARVYMEALRDAGIPAVFRTGPGLFSQPEVLLFFGALSLMVGLDTYYGSPQGRNLPRIIQDELGCAPEPLPVIRAASAVLRHIGLPLAEDVEDRLILAANLIHERLNGNQIVRAQANSLRCEKLRRWVRNRRRLRRVFPQLLYQLLLEEAEVSTWDLGSATGSSILFHLGQLSSLIKGIETPGWTQPGELRYQIIALYLWGARRAQIEINPLMVSPNAVTISTIHGAKGLEFTAVFLGDVNAQRFPSNMSRRLPELPYDGELLRTISPTHLADNSNHDSERRLMYVAVTRAERYLFVSSSGSRRSSFFRRVEGIVGSEGGATGMSSELIPSNIELRATVVHRSLSLSTSFSDLRYFIECPHDFYLRKVMGFAPSIDQAFGYGRGVHNLMRAIHSNPRHWAELSTDDRRLEREIRRLILQGLFYMRYTTGEPLENMQNKAVAVISDYVRTYVGELAQLQFEPEREFETLLEEEEVLVSGAIDVIRLDDPPRVTLVDFKSGEALSDSKNKLDQNQMKLQVSLYGLAAREELEYEPERGLVRYLGEKDPDERELNIELNEQQLIEAREAVIGLARNIKNRNFHIGPSGDNSRCRTCDWQGICSVRCRE